MKNKKSSVGWWCGGGNRENRRENGSALVISLTILMLVMILVVGIMTIARIERASANNYFESLRAKSLATMGIDNATALIREACDAGSKAGKFWSSQPGKITVFNSDGSEDTSLSRFLYSTTTSGSAVDLTKPTVNLNQAGFGGIAPIASANSTGTTGTPSMEVNWQSVLQDPASAAGATNRIVGRYAFWVDDESAKLNVNTADGTAKDDTGGSFGPGTPTETSLTALRQGASSNISSADAQAIAKQSGAKYDSSAQARPFNDPTEILRVTGSTVAADNDFNTTAYSRAPELNLFGEPKIYLTTVTNATTPLCAMTGSYAYSGTGGRPSTINGGSLSQIYPVSSTAVADNQLPNFTYRPYGTSKDVTVPLPQFFHDSSSPLAQQYTANSTDYALGMRIAQYLKGKNSRGEDIVWPQFDGASSSGFAGKYTDRQIDSIALQILSLLKASYVDHYNTFSIPYVMPSGFLSGKLVRGLSRGPRVNEIVVEITTVEASPAPKVAMAIYVEWYLPEGFGGCSLDGNDVKNWNYGNGNWMNILNFQDAVQLNPSPSLHITGPSPLGGYWMDNMLTFLDQDGNAAGVDLNGNDPSIADLDQDRAELYHNYTTASRTPEGKLYGSGPAPGIRAPMLGMYSPMAYYGSGSPPQIWKPGEYRATINSRASSYYPTKAGVTSIKLSGGLALGLHTNGGNVNNGWNVDPVPLDSLRGTFMGESLSDTSVRTAVLNAVIPMPNVTIPIPGHVTIHFQVADPLVNSFPGDWVTTVNPPDSEITMVKPTGRDPTVYTTGRNTIANPANGGDPLASWWPNQSVDTPKSQRFPSVGYLQYVHTGLMPDKTYDTQSVRNQKGTPCRVLNFAPSTAASQQTDGGDSYPDWAMLDLFTVPAAFQPLGSPAPTPIQLTWGGATAGRVNPNGPMLPFSTISRTVPLEGLFKGVNVSTSYVTSGSSVQTTVDERELAKAVNQYVAKLGRPLITPGEICNVPEVANFLYTGVSGTSQSRNDLVRQIVGNLTTRSNTFCIWAVGQVIKKTPGHTDYGNYETGDLVLGESKLKVLIERRLDYGADGVPGNAKDPGADGIIGTPDDPVDSVYHPAMTYPLSYKYRVVSVREIVN